MTNDAKPNGIVYSHDDGTVSVYEMRTEGRQILEIRVDNADPELRIGFARPDWEKTGDVVRYRGGVALRGLTSYQVGPSEADVEVKDHIITDTIRTWVYPRVGYLMADVYVPKDGA